MNQKNRKSFLVHLYGALQHLGPTTVYTDYGAPKSETDAIAAAIGRWELWLRSRQLAAYDPFDFPELSTETHNLLPQLIQTYPDTADQWRGEQRPDLVSLNRARTALIEIGTEFKDILRNERKAA